LKNLTAVIPITPIESFRSERVGEKLSSILYKLLSTTNFQTMHDSSYTQFSFSPISPFLKHGEFEKDITYSFEVRSPNMELINTLHDQLEKRRFLEIDYKKLELGEVSYFRSRSGILEATTISPVVISVSDKMAEKYGIEKRSKTLYWTPKMNFQLFIDSLNRNMVRKWNRWNREQFDESLQIIESYQLLKSFPIVTPYKRGKVAGSLWRFRFQNGFEDIVDFNYLTGFGEKSGSGFGFMK
jgi:CRISPR-associated endoribonuclease Cas6